MIKNKKQLNSAKAKLRKWLQTSEQLAEGAAKDETDWLQAERSFGVEQQIKQLQGEIKEYEDTVAGTLKLADPCVVLDIPHLLISWRIARNWTQKDLAERVDMHENQIQKYEAENYEMVSLHILSKIATVLCEKSSSDEHSHAHLVGHS